MRLEQILALRQAHVGQIQPLPAVELTGLVGRDVTIPRRLPWQQRLKDRVAPLALAWQQPAVRRRLGQPLPFRCDQLCVEERFGNESSLHQLRRWMGHAPAANVLMVGCSFGTEEVQDWLAAGVERFEGIDIYSFRSVWEIVAPRLAAHYRCQVRFSQASVEALLFADGAFDLLNSSAVLEHVRDLDLAVGEMARVLRPGGWAWHGFGPLYFTWGGDHCISSYGLEHGYDHLLRPEAEYRPMIRDQAHFDTTADPNQNYWAKTDQFSFLRPAEYLEILERHFHVRHTVAKISGDGLRFRDACPREWQTLLDAGLSEADLLTKSLALVLQKK